MTTIESLLNEARAARRTGNLDQAQRLCQRALGLAPDNGELRYTLGCLLVQTGNPSAAEQELEAACRLEPGSAGAHMAMGELFIMMGRWNDAVAPLARAVNIVPDFVPCRINLAVALGFSGRTADAEALFSEILESDPRNVEAHGAFACVLNAQKRFAEAESHSRVGVDLAPDHVSARRYLATALIGLERWDEAETALVRTIELKPDLLQAHLDLIEVYRRRGRLVEAEPAARRALAVAPNDPNALYAVGAVLNDLSCWSEAVDSLTQAIGIQPEFLSCRLTLGAALSNANRFAEAEAQFIKVLDTDRNNVEALANLAYVLNAQRRYEEGEEQARIAVGLVPEYDLALNILGVSLHGMGRAVEAAEMFEQALRLAPSNTTYMYWQWNALLLSGDFARGFPAYERWKREARFKYREFPRPRWDGSPIPGRTLLVYSDHGFGDAFQALRFLPVVKTRSQARIVFEGQAELLPLVANDPSIAEIVVQHPDERPPAADYDAVIGLTSLAGLFCATVEELPSSVPYVYPGVERVEAWRDRLAQWPGFRIGICWTGDPRNPTNVFRSCRLAEFVGIGAIPGVRLFSLQVGPGAQEALDPPRGMSLVDLGPYLSNFEETAAALTNLDLIVAVETSTAHLAGALGRPTLVPLTDVSWWMWMVGRDDSPWYPTVKLVRQTVRDDWRSVFARLEVEVRAVVEAHFERQRSSTDVAG